MIAVMWVLLCPLQSHLQLLPGVLPARAVAESVLLTHFPNR